MKRFALLLIAISAMLPASAALTSTDKEVPAELPVFWDLNSISDYYVQRFGFSKSDAGESDPVGTDGYSLTTAIDGTRVTGEGEVYIWWNIEAPMKIVLEIEVLARMEGKASGAGESDTTLDWGASWSVAGSSVSGSASISPGSVGILEDNSSSRYGSSQIVTHNGLASTGAVSSGYCCIDIKTVNAYTAAIRDYSGTITLQIDGDA